MWSLQKIAVKPSTLLDICIFIGLSLIGMGLFFWFGIGPALTGIGGLFLGFGVWGHIKQ